MLALDRAGDPLADQLRDAMDSLWYGLTDEEHAALNTRLVIDESDAQLKMQGGDDLFMPPPEVKPLVSKKDPLVVYGWECAA